MSAIPAGGWGPCLGCGQRMHRYGPGGRARCVDCQPVGNAGEVCRRCQAPNPRLYHNGLRLCLTCRPLQPPTLPPLSVQRGSQPRQRLTRHSVPLWLALDLVRPRPRRDLATPTGGFGPPRPCSRCRQTAVTTTPRGRPVHPSCEGWLDRLSDAGLADLTWAVVDLLPVLDIREETW